MPWRLPDVQQQNQESQSYANQNYAEQNYAEQNYAESKTTLSKTTQLNAILRLIQWNLLPADSQSDATLHLL